MFINIKYHIVSIVSIFMALGLGILIGSAFPEDVALVAQQHQLVCRLESSIDYLRLKNESLQARINTLEMENDIKNRFENKIMPTLVKDKLKGHNIAIIVTNGHDCPAGIINTLKMAGSEIINISTLIYEKMTDKMENSQCSRSSLTEELVKAVAAGNKEFTDILQKEAFIKTEGIYGSKITDLIIITGGNERQVVKAGEVGNQVIEYLKGKGINVLGVEESDVVYSGMNIYHKMGLTTVDNIESVAGRVALVYALDSRPGRYGIKPSARQLLPGKEDGVTENDR